MKEKIERFLPANVKLISQGDIVARSLVNYLNRHPEIEKLCSKNESRVFYTTDSTEDFDNHASTFFGEPVHSKHLDLGY
jgi:glutamate racemase